jgi:hypothetical protein
MEPVRADDPTASDGQAAPVEGGAPPGSRIEQVWMTVKLVLDLVTVPFHLVVFAFTRGRHRRAFRRALEESRP